MRYSKNVSAKIYLLHFPAQKKLQVLLGQDFNNLDEIDSVWVRSFVAVCIFCYMLIFYPIIPQYNASAMFLLIICVFVLSRAHLWTRPKNTSKKLSKRLLQGIFIRSNLQVKCLYDSKRIYLLNLNTDRTELITKRIVNTYFMYTECFYFQRIILIEILQFAMKKLSSKHVVFQTTSHVVNL